MDQNQLRKIQERTKKVPTASGRSEKWQKNYFADLVFLPAQVAKKPIDYFKEEVNSKTVIGKKSKKPIEIETPIIIGAMSFGALGKEAKITLAKASTIAGTMENTGEGGMLPGEREFSKKLIIQYSTGRFGITEEILRGADAVEIKIGQGAKGGQGGLLPKEKVTDEIAEVRKIEKNKDVHSPAYHPDIENVEELKKKVEWLREITGGVPIIIKVAAGDIENDLKLLVKANPDIIAIDGLEGGTGAAPEVMLDEVGLPTIAAVSKARKILDDLGVDQELWIGGGLNKGGDFAKALSLGADAVFTATPLLVAMGCTYCRLCHFGKCPKGIATQDPELRKNLNVEEAAQKVSSYIKSCTEEIKMIAAAVGLNDIYKLNKDHLRALTLETAKITNTKFISE